VHSHTWYANFAGQLNALIHDVPHIITAHSLEPFRPWKAEQLGEGYRISSWVEATTYRDADRIIAVSAGMRRDILNAYPKVQPDRVDVVHNGVDTDQYRPDPNAEALDTYRIDPDLPYVLFVGRITRQKGIIHLIRAASRFTEEAQLVLCAAAPDTPELGAETAAAIAELREIRGDERVIWIEEPVPQGALIQLFTHARAFVCPSIYEPLGIVNLEAMACECAVVASNVGGIPEVVADGVTGILVPYDEHEPRAFEHALGDAVNQLLADPARARAMGAAGRARAVTDFGWDAIAQRTIAVYDSAINS
jgi:alpha-maltose-1-phosphate synthase